MRFPHGLCFQLTLEEFSSNWSQIATSSGRHRDVLFASNQLRYRIFYARVKGPKFHPIFPGKLSEIGI
jgi:hypothetical protein